jgi:outer membrane protein W
MALLLSVPLLAQTNEIGAFVNHPSFSSTAETVLPLFETAALTVDSKVGYGLSFTHAISGSLALQLSAQTVRGDAKLDVAGGVQFTDRLGTLDLKQYDAALHWYFVRQDLPVRPYVGAGVAWIQGGKLKIPADPAHGIVADSVSLDNKVAGLVDAGVDFRVSHDAKITLAVKYTQYRPRDATTPPRARTLSPSDVLFGPLKLDTMTVSAGVRWAF